MPDRTQTIRKEIITYLSGNPSTVRDISKEIGIMEKDAFAHLTFVEKSLKTIKKKLRMEPYRCLNCDYVFKTRKKLNKPGKCPDCKKERIEPAVFWIEDK